MPINNKHSEPYRCTLRIQSTPEQGQHLKNLYAPLLQGIDPTFQLIQINTSKNNDNNKEMINDNALPAMGLSTQALSIILFLRDDAHSQLRAAVAKDYLSYPPWMFHHKIELTSPYDFRTVARQEYYDCAPRHHYPLWCVSSVHCGNEQLRFNIFVKDLDQMTQFYSSVLDEKVQASKSGFCLFRIYCQPGLEIQLSLKYSPCLLPETTESAQLCFVVDSVTRLQRAALPYKIVANKDGTWRTRDPDGNAVVLMENALLSCDSDSDYGHFV